MILYYSKINEKEKNISIPTWKHQLNTIQQKIENNYSDISLYLQAAKILLENNEVNEAKKYVEDALELDFNNPALLGMYQQLLK